MNRTCAGKEDTFVLDFYNEREDIFRAFKPYYEATTIADIAEAPGGLLLVPGESGGLAVHGGRLYVGTADSLVAYGLPQWRSGSGPPSLTEDLWSIGAFGVLVMPLVIPWSYVWRHYVKAPAERWRYADGALTGSSLKALRLLKAYAMQASGQEDSVEFRRMLDGIYPWRTEEFVWLTAPWPQMAAFVSSNLR